MADRAVNPVWGQAASAAKAYFFASRSLMEAILRPFDLGGTQWYVLQQLADRGQISQRDLAPLLHIERASASDIVLTLVRKGLVAQAASATDQRQKVVRLTDDGRRLWSRLPDPMHILHAVAFEDVPAADVATVVRVLSGAAERLERSRAERNA